jgi:hypothetical protein
MNFIQLNRQNGCPCSQAAAPSTMTKNPPKITVRSPPEPHDNGNTIQTKATTPPHPTAEQKTYPNLLAARVSDRIPTEETCKPTPPPFPPFHTSSNTNADYHYSFSFGGGRITVNTPLLIASFCSSTASDTFASKVPNWRTFGMPFSAQNRSPFRLQQRSRA